jgi:molecular chaperone GrpE
MYYQQETLPMSDLDAVDRRLESFETVSPEENSTKSLDTSFADRFLKVFTRLAKAQWKTQKNSSHSAKKVEEYLEEHGDLLDDLKSQKADLEDQNEQLERFIIDILDLITGFERTADSSGDPEMQSTASTMREALETSMEKIGLKEIPAIGEVPDSMYHFVLDTRPPEDQSEQDRIVEVVEPGYTLHGNVLRKAHVIVAKT